MRPCVSYFFSYLSIDIPESFIIFQYDILSPTLLSDLFTNGSYDNILHCSLGGYRGEGHGSEGGGDSKEGE